MAILKVLGSKAEKQQQQQATAKADQQKTAYEMQRSLVGSEMCIRDRRSVPLPTGFLVGIAMVIGVISGGTATAVLLPDQRDRFD